MSLKVAPERVKRLNDFDVKNRKYVLYWMQSSQRTEYNMALNYAIEQANHLNKPLVVFFGVKPDFPDANLRHYSFMFEGLYEVQSRLNQMQIRLVVKDSSPELGVVELATDACMVVVDKGYLKLLKHWYSHAAQHLNCPLIQIEDNIVVPVEEASPKEEYAAATLRPKNEAKQESFLNITPTVKPQLSSLRLYFSSLDLSDASGVLADLNVDASVGKTAYFSGGTSEALKHLEFFVNYKLPSYPEARNNPTIDGVSNLSPYLHFGQVSPLHVAVRVLESDAPEGSKSAYLEELIVRRELAINYIHYNPNYDSLEGLPNWAKSTLDAHKDDPREYIYSLEELENAKTHDPYWNAAQNQMRITGKMHGYMRMYWGKKILEWTQTPQEAFKAALYLNNKYELDGRDPNGYTGVAWCFGKHDRPWRERAIFGKVRYMNANGLRRKFDADKYAQTIQNLNRSPVAV
ncbi:MAG: deoxyribodipyrimidine photo-lyase [Candidatus Bathyarchaeota archaeon]|nr:deoxyribodipyrimidine photo-lyase [Candidatus Bathyarchaeota archaeon]